MTKSILPPSFLMLQTFKQHWPHYLAEAAGLAFFMTNASLVTTLLRSPLSPLAGKIQEPWVGLVALGVPMGFVIAAIVYSPWGKKSGAHINPAVTFAFWRLGKIKTPDALFYVLFQFLGGALAVQIMGLILGKAYSHPVIKYVATIPGPSGPIPAFIAEFFISLVLMLAILSAANSKKTEKWVGAIAGFLIALYLMFEEPYSGMSLNPARSFASAFAAREWKDLWIYFVSPLLAMFLAAEIFARLTKGQNNLPEHPMEESEEKPEPAEKTAEVAA